MSSAASNMPASALRRVAIGALRATGLSGYAQIALHVVRSLSRSGRETRARRRRFYSQFVQPGDLCFDVGANLGNRVEVFLDLGARVIAVEPQRLCNGYLRMRFGPRVAIVDAALGEHEGAGEIMISDAPTISSMAPEWIDAMKSTRFQEYSWNRRQRVAIRTLDSLVQQFGRPAFCKIDVEGFELRVLKGLTQKLGTVSFEFAIPEFTARALDCLRHLAALGAVECNYSMGESMSLELPAWVDSQRMEAELQRMHGERLLFGDVYVRFV
jgi:FkbM family methyltransferase